MVLETKINFIFHVEKNKSGNSLNNWNGLRVPLIAHGSARYSSSATCLVSKVHTRPFEHTYLLSPHPIKITNSVPVVHSALLT